MPKQSEPYVRVSTRNSRLSEAAHDNWCSDWDTAIVPFMKLIKVLKDDGWTAALDRLGEYWSNRVDGGCEEKSGLISLLQKGIKSASKKEIQKGWNELYSRIGRTTWIGIQFVEQLHVAEKQNANTPAKGRAGRRIEYSIDAHKYANELRSKNDSLTAKEIRRECLKKFNDDDMPKPEDLFRSWMNRTYKIRLIN